MQYLCIFLWFFSTNYGEQALFITSLISFCKLAITHFHAFWRVLSREQRRSPLIRLSSIWVYEGSGTTWLSFYSLCLNLCVDGSRALLLNEVTERRRTANLHFYGLFTHLWLMAFRPFFLNFYWHLSLFIWFYISLTFATFSAEMF